MASKRTKSSRPEMIHCPYCGEDYSSTYKHCPFCDEIEQDGDYDDYDAPRRGGKRLVTNTRGGGYTSTSPLKMIGTVVSLALIIAAVIIVISIIKPLVSRGNVETPDPSAPVETETVAPSADPTGTPDPTATPGPEDTTAPETESPSVPEGQTATGFSLDKTEFSFSNAYPYPVSLKVTFIPAGSTGTITWTSSDPSIASVDANGTVSHGTKKGTATITASMPGAPDVTCKVYNSATTSEGVASAGGSGGTGTSTSLSLNHTDFSFNALDNPSVQMKVNGTSSTPTWSISNSSVATISADGVVRPAGNGTATITCTVDGQTLTCIVRCKF